ncbi:alkylation response protein AidB-like acyl-CoA dehydrogenase [Bradyrhizobium japonicum]|jgi:alkylation response protein AidB-like acyl-CoA dehydrogenase|uniref:acyl-CoA dehydrogenase family protein n=1 Tax=Bradyrhizobium TaxID=374 RepID=UPI00040FB8A2|nr:MULTISPECIES: acyl-CoA dehydrogenase family protein [Bradyrhizobium]MBR0876692.1 acyl-CoA dehydrogenase [Bradyrhizobium liaoningense]MBR0940901.1 acyl-CoA dehydrogenase [Bradyrhizobium liaoningense]MBR0997126.1 acyl-CoA dehydrogenase [Bradyrhizobium liaoningense]MBR1031395.1 acyl-CoA dehydrogenase [Bradyrhizobium liaoningense]MBR1064263.1 acyl-CoA dehydrogenase [Bradyrhizobium liaoningense]
MNATPGFGLVERVRAIAPLIAGEAEDIERTRRLTPAVVSALIESGLYRALLPQSLGGAEAPIEIFMQMQEEIAKADASTAWCLGQCSVCAMIAASLDHHTANEIFNTAPGILAWGAIAHEARAVEGGYRVTARWDFASGSRQASWLGAHVRIVGADGTLRKNTDGSPEVRTILFPVASAVLHDVWQAIGLAGTGTDSYEVSDLFIPERFTAFRDVPSALVEKGPLYRIGTGSTFSLGFAAVSLGVARATLDAAIALSRAKHQSLAASAMRDNQAVQGLIGRTEGDLRAARAYLYATANAMWHDLCATGQFSPAHRSAVRLAATWTIHQSAKVVDAAYHMAGATAVFRSNPFERRFRDMHAIAQQIQARDTHYEDVGKAILAGN